MSETQAPSRPFVVGDRVEVRRNLDHPVWMTQIPADDRGGDTRWVRRDDLDEVMYESVITDLGRENFRLVARIESNRFWYRQDTGLQNGSEATYIVHITEPKE